MKEKSILLFAVLAFASCEKPKEPVTEAQPVRESKPSKPMTPPIAQRENSAADHRETSTPPPVPNAPARTISPAQESAPTPEPKLADSSNEPYLTAKPVPGQAGFVFSPYNNKVVDVRDIPTGTLVQDPTFPPSEKKFFRAP